VELQVNLQTFRLDDSKDSALAKSMSRPELYRLSARMLTLQQQLLTSADYDAAQIESLRSAQPGSGSAQFLYALSLLRQNKTEEARQVLGTALELSPQEPDLLGLWQSLGAVPAEGAAP
jgi:Flp pilus assembly protein TadD